MNGQRRTLSVFAASSSQGAILHAVCGEMTDHFPLQGSLGGPGRGTAHCPSIATRNRSTSRPTLFPEPRFPIMSLQTSMNVSLGLLLQLFFKSGDCGLGFGVVVKGESINRFLLLFDPSRFAEKPEFSEWSHNK